MIPMNWWKFPMKFPMEIPRNEWEIPFNSPWFQDENNIPYEVHHVKIHHLSCLTIPWNPGKITRVFLEETKHQRSVFRFWSGSVWPSEAIKKGIHHKTEVHHGKCWGNAGGHGKFGKWWDNELNNSQLSTLGAKYNILETGALELRFLSPQSKISGAMSDGLKPIVQIDSNCSFHCHQVSRVKLNEISIQTTIQNDTSNLNFKSLLEITTISISWNHR